MSNPVPETQLPRKRRRWLLRIVVIFVAILLVGSASGLWFVRSVLNSSLPVYNGTYSVEGLQQTVRIERDAQGVPTLVGSHFTDLAFGLGVVHAQERFFQMDLLRRKSAGELSALVGPAALTMDTNTRAHRFRTRMKAVWEKMSPAEQAPIKSYCRGVAFGLQHGFTDHDAKPFEYHLLREEPTPWAPEDCLLVVCSMYLELQASQNYVEMTRANLRASLPPDVADFLDPDGTAWDAAIDGSTVPQPSLPTPAQINFKNNPSLKNLSTNILAIPHFDQPVLGSNNWAVSGKNSKHGGALVADDMHLGINLPNIWYRACMKWTDADGTPRQACGVTLPGGPALVAGSNGYVAWGFTNTEGSWLNLLAIETDATNSKQYKTPTGLADFIVHEETIDIKGEPSRKIRVVDTIWGPVTHHDLNSRPYVTRWVAHQPDGVNLKSIGILHAKTLEEAIAVAATCGIPHQNFTCGDRSGRIGWTIAGRIPQRMGTSQRGASPALKQHNWTGFLAAAEYPRVIDPPQGRIWTANNRVVGGEMFAKLGNGGADIGHRAGQIRDRLLSLESADEKDMLAIQLDDEARSLQKWKKLYLETVPEDPQFPRRTELRKILADWDGFARAEGMGYYILDQFRGTVSSLVMQPFQELASKKLIFSGGILLYQQIESPVWALVSQQPEHLLNPRFPSWQALFQEAANRVAIRIQQSGQSLDKLTWGQVNAARVKHQLSSSIPVFGKYLDMPDAALHGARRDLPRVSSPGHGVSERFAVSPGKEEHGIFHMPGGQSGHPLSPHYRDGHAAWEQGLPTPFLPGAKVNEIVLQAAR